MLNIQRAAAPAPPSSQANISHHQLCKRLLYHPPSSSLGTALHCKQSRDIPLKLITFFATEEREEREGGFVQEGRKAGSPFPLSRYQARKKKRRGREGEVRGLYKTSL